jgi:hypothetical protein
MREIPLTKGRSAVVDDEDYAALAGLKWRAFECKSGGKWYAMCGGTYMHRMIMRAPAGTPVDHINRNGLDNRRCNLRLCSPSQNQANRIVPRSKKYRGVEKKGDKFVAVVKFAGRRYRRGPFDVAARAALAYDWMARQIHGEFAVLNFQV